MQQQLDLTRTIALLVDMIKDSCSRITDLEAKVTALNEQLACSDMNSQVRKLSFVSSIHTKIRRVVFVGRDYFGDNIKYALLDFVQSARHHNCDVWFLPIDEKQEDLVKALGISCFSYDFKAWTAEDIGRALETALTVHCEHNHMWQWKDLRIRALFHGAKQVQLWHGIPIKEVGLKYVRGGRDLNAHECEILATCGKFEAFVGTSQDTESEWRRFFIFDHYAPLGLPRNDALMREATTQDLVNVDIAAYERVKIAHQEGKPVYIYAPTFRDKVGAAWFPPEGLQDVLTSPLAQQAVILINLHPFEQYAVPDLKKRYPDFLFLAPGTDLYPVLRFANALITDYSSLIFDFLLLDRPIILYRPDHHRYQAESRALFEKKIADLPGHICETAPQLAAALEELLHTEDECSASRRALLRTWFDHLDGGASARVTNLILGLLPPF